MFHRIQWEAVKLLSFMLWVAVERVVTFREVMRARPPAFQKTHHVEHYQSFKQRLSDMLKPGVSYQKQPNIYYDAGDQAEFRRPDAVRCEPSFTQAPGTQDETQCQKLAILLHGFTSCPGTWYSIQPRLTASGFCVLRPTLPGHGYQPSEGVMETVKLNIDKTTWSKINGNDPGKEILVYTGLLVEPHVGKETPRCRMEHGLLCYKVKDVSQGKFFEFNTLVAKFEVGGNLDMILPGDIITSIKPNLIDTSVDESGKLYFKYLKDAKTGDATSAKEYWKSSRSYIEIKIARQGLKDNLDDLPTSKTWPVYVDFTHELAKLALAFKSEQSNRQIVMMGHSLGAVAATATMLNAAALLFHPALRSINVFDRVLLFNPAFGVDPSFGWALKTVGAWYPFTVNDAKCQRTRRTLGTGGYCTFRTDHVRAVHEFGKYSVCSLIQARGDDHLPIWCRVGFGNMWLLQAHARIAADIQLVTTSGDPAIYNGHVERAADEVVAQLGEDRVGFCNLMGELGHNFLNELDATEKRDFWWTSILNRKIMDFLQNGTKFPLAPIPGRMCMMRE